MLDKLKQFDRTRLILGIIILVTIPCYCIGMILLWNTNLARGQKTPTATLTPEGTRMGSITPTFTLPALSATVSLTPTITTTFTPTITYVLPPTRTASPSPSPSPTNTLIPSPTYTDTPVPSPTFTATEAPTSTSAPSETP
jgi:hypothetical protein